MAVAAPLMIAGAGVQMMGQMQQQEQQNAARYGQWLQGEHGKSLQADRKNEQINQAMQSSMKRNSQIADYSLDQMIYNSQAVTSNVRDKQRMVNVASRRGSAMSDASSSSRGISTDSASAKAIKRSELNAMSEQLSSLEGTLSSQLMQQQETRKRALGSRDSKGYAPVNFSASSAPIPTDNTFGIVAGGLLNMASIGAGAGYFGATE